MSFAAIDSGHHQFGLNFSRECTVACLMLHILCQTEAMRCKWMSRKRDSLSMQGANQAEMNIKGVAACVGGWVR